MTRPNPVNHHSTRAGLTIVAGFDATAVTALYQRYGKGARKIIREGFQVALKPVKEKQKAAWLNAPYKRNGKRRVRRAIAACVTIKRKPYRTVLGYQDHAAVGIDYQARRYGYRQRVAHLLERGRGGKHPLARRLIAYRVNVAELPRALDRMNKFVMGALNRA